MIMYGWSETGPEKGMILKSSVSRYETSAGKQALIDWKESINFRLINGKAFPTFFTL